MQKLHKSFRSNTLIFEFYFLGDCDVEKEGIETNDRRHHHQQQPQDTNFLCLSDDESNYSISRSSSLLQFETLEKQCQDLSTSSPSILSSFTYDSLENRRNIEASDNDYYRMLKIEKAANMRDTLSNLREEYLNKNKFDSTSSEETLDTSPGDDGEVNCTTLKQSKSYDDINFNDSSIIKNKKNSFCSLDDSLDDDEDDEEETKHLETNKRDKNKKQSTDYRVWNSFDNLPNVNVNHTQTKIKDRASAENLSEDSGYSDNLTTTTSTASTTMKFIKRDKFTTTFRQSKSTSDFDAYDCDVNHSFTNTNLGVSYHDLRLLGNNVNKTTKTTTPSAQTTPTNQTAPNTFFKRLTNNSKNNLVEFKSIISEESSHSCSVPDLLTISSTTSNGNSSRRYLKKNDCNNRKTNNKLFIYTNSVPKDLNLFGNEGTEREDKEDNEEIDEKVVWQLNNDSIAAKNLDLCDALLCNNNNRIMADKRRTKRNVNAERIFIPLKGGDSSPEPDVTPSFKREGNLFFLLVNMLNYLHHLQALNMPFFVSNFFSKLFCCYFTKITIKHPVFFQQRSYPLPHVL